MAGIRAGRVWVGHGDLIAGLDMRVGVKGHGPVPPSAAGCRSATATRSRSIVKIQLADSPNFAQFTPKLNRVDLIVGDVLGPTTDRDSFTTPNTKVVKSWDTSGRPTR